MKKDIVTDMMLMLSKMMPEEEILDGLIKACIKYKGDKNDSNKDGVLFSSLL
jgi:hypothetical protein